MLHQTSFSSLTHCQGMPSQDMGIRSTNQDQYIEHNAATIPPRHHHNCQKEQKIMKNARRIQKRPVYCKVQTDSSRKHLFV